MIDKTTSKKISMASTKQEMIDAYNAVLKELQEKEKMELKPEEKIERIKNKDILEKADTLSTEGVVTEISSLKLDIGKMLTQISDRLEEEVAAYKKVKGAICIQENELQDIYSIKKEAQSLAALLEAQTQKRRDFESQMSEEKSELNLEINTMRAQWEKEKEQHKVELKNLEAEEQKKRQRDKDQNFV